MFYIHDTDQIGQESPSVVTIGKFDGFHRGHQKILREACACRDGGEGRQVVVFTFSRSPQWVISGENGVNLNTWQEKLALARQFGVDGVVEYPFTDRMRHLSAEDFLEKVLRRELRACAIVAGPDCSFGYQRRGNVEFLRERAREGNFSLHVVEKERYGGEVISSTRIRACLAAGRIEEANAMLGYPFGYRSEVRHGHSLGRKLGFPTVNQDIPAEKLIPARGVYASEVLLGDRCLSGISNVGVKPTVSGEGVVGMETSIFDFSEEIYGKTIRVNLLHFIRPERHFPSLEALQRQVAADREKVREYGRET